MLSIKQKLRSSRGASMVMAMVFLLFCTLIGGSVLASATANASRIEHMTKDQQAYYSQRSAALLMADMLKGEDGKELQLMITDVVVQKNADTEHTVTFASPNVTARNLQGDLEMNFLQQLLFEAVVSTYPVGSATADHTYFGWEDGHVFVPDSGKIQISDGMSAEDLTASFSVDIGGDYDVSIHFGEGFYSSVAMDGSVGRGTPKSVTVGDTTTTTTTTIIRWSLPDVRKGGA